MRFFLSSEVSYGSPLSRNITGNFDGWRRRMGVEPTRDRLTAPPGFEVRSPHRERDSSVVQLRRIGRKQGDARRVDAAQVLAADGETVPVEELQDLDGDFAPVVEPVAELGGTEPALRRLGGQVDGDLGHLLHHGAEEVVVVRDLIDI